MNSSAVPLGPGGFVSDRIMDEVEKGTKFTLFSKEVRDLHHKTQSLQQEDFVNLSLDFSHFKTHITEIVNTTMLLKMRN